MKIKRFVAPDMRQALRMVRETLGEDAVILSNKSIENGVELTAAVDLVPEEASPSASRQAPLRARPQRPAARAGAHTGPNPAQSNRASGPRRTETRPAAQPAGEVPPEALTSMREEMHNLRRWLQAELSSMSWYDLGQRSPHIRELFQHLMQLGLSADIVERLVECVDRDAELAQAWRQALNLLTGEIGVFEQDLLEQGGVVALVGPTGVGKTTTIAKIAARFALRHGHRNIALISTDNFRIGARDQLHTYGRILNVPVRSADDPEVMREAIASLSDRRLILIDTAGMGGDTERFQQQVETLRAAGDDITTLLTLSATTEGTALEKAIDLFSVTTPSACLLTKLDEAASLGAAISAVIHSGLPLAFLADGQRVPEDLTPARAHTLVERAADLLDSYPAECDSAYVALSYRGNSRNASI